MTSHSNSGMSMALDEYYDHCVLPKPNIPKKYPGVRGKSEKNNQKERQAAHLRSYKDSKEDDEDDEDDRDTDEAEHRQELDEFTMPIEDTNRTQLHYELIDFNQAYDSTEVEEPIDETPNNTAVPVGSAQWRIQSSNVNRPTGAPPLVPTNAPEAYPWSTARPANSQQQGPRFNRINNNINNINRNNNINFNSSQHSAHRRLGYRNPYSIPTNFNANQQQSYIFSNNSNNCQQQDITNYNNNNTVHQQQQQLVLKNTNNHLQNGYSQRQLNGQLNPRVLGRANRNFNGPNAMMNNSVNSQMNRTGASYNCNNQTTANPFKSVFNSANQIGNSTNNINTGLSRLCLPSPTQSFGRSLNMQPSQAMNQTSSVPEDSVRLIDLVKMGSNTLSIPGVAKNAILLLSGVFGKPINDADIEQELSELQQQSRQPENQAD